ncbi:MAG: TIGR00303 family protein [Leptolyngbyaceae bacterium]|nr:TIGR00303 family protein [Leptolyngbyaceae bacterium]
MMRIHSESSRVIPWIEAVTERRPLFACVLGFTETALIPGISAAGATPADRQFTAIADAEFLYNGPTANPQYPLPPLHAGASPVLISRAVTAEQQIPIQIFNAGLPHPPPVPFIDLNGTPARCLTTGQAMSKEHVQRLFQAGLDWGDRMGLEGTHDYLILAECVVGGTTTALAVLTALGWAVEGMVNSSHPTCNHQQKQTLVAQGLHHLQKAHGFNSQSPDPLQIVAGLGDPVQVAIAGMLLTASRSCRVMLAGGTQMLAMYALASAIASTSNIVWNPDQVVVGTTRWVVDDPTGNTVGLAKLLRCPLISTELSFADSRYASLRAYEEGFVKEGVGAGGCAIAAHLYQNWTQKKLLATVEAIAAAHQHSSSLTDSLTNPLTEM